MPPITLPGLPLPDFDLRNELDSDVPDDPDFAVPISRLNPIIECLVPSSFLFSFSLADRGTPSHFELTLGTVGGKVAVETPARPTGFGRPSFIDPCFCNWRW